jgi:hypothetical protein
MEKTRLDVLAGLMANASTINNNIQMQHQINSNAYKQRTIDSLDSPLRYNKTWQLAGFEVVESEVSSEAALAMIQSIPLKRYKLKDDKQQDLAVSRTQRRTRYHVGPVASDDDAKSVNNPSSIFSYNIGAIAELTKSTEILSSKLLSSSSFLHHHSFLEEKISHLKSITGSAESFKTPAQLASEVAALETEVALKRITQLCFELVQSTKINVVYARLASRLKSLAANDWSSEKMTRIEREFVSVREIKAENANVGLDTVLIYLSAIEKVETLWNSTMR